MNKTALTRFVATLTKEHPLSIYSGSPFYAEFEQKICSLQLSQSKIDEKIEELLKDNGKFSIFKYNQGIAELLIWFWLESNNIPYQIEKTVNGTEKNVDAQAQYNSIFYNIEIKSPEYEEHKAGHLCGIIANRTEGKELINLAEHIRSILQNQMPTQGYSDVDIELPHDNKVKSALTFAQGKFSENSNSSCNILFIATTTAEFLKYLNYIINGQTGFFTPHSFMPHADFNKVKAIVLSNAISLHQQYDDKSWDISNAINLVLSNPYCEYEDCSILNGILQIFPHQTIEFFNGLEEFRKERSDDGRPMPDYIYFTDYVAKHGFNLNKNI